MYPAPRRGAPAASGVDPESQREVLGGRVGEVGHAFEEYDEGALIEGRLAAAPGPAACSVGQRKGIAAGYGRIPQPTTLQVVRAKSPVGQVSSMTSCEARTSTS